MYLTENIQRNEVSHAASLKDFTDSGFLTLGLERRPYRQKGIYQLCIEEHASQHNWMAFLDLDEFVILRNPCAASHTRGTAPLRASAMRIPAW